MKLKNIIITGIVFVIIILSFTIPTVLFEIQDIVMTKDVYKRGRIEGKIDVQAENIYLVQVIQKRGYNVEIGKANKIQEKGEIVYSGDTIKSSTYSVLERELMKLSDYKILDGELKETNSNTSIGMLDKKYLNGTMEYIINCIDITNDKNLISVEIESKTEKILYIEFEKYRMLKINIEDMMRNYVNYLDLYIIEDWKFENGILSSNKAQLAVSLIENDNTYELSIHSLNKNSNLQNYYLISR